MHVKSEVCLDGFAVLLDINFNHNRTACSGRNGKTASVGRNLHRRDGFVRRACRPISGIGFFRKRGYRINFFVRNRIGIKPLQTVGFEIGFDNVDVEHQRDNFVYKIARSIARLYGSIHRTACKTAHFDSDIIVHTRHKCLESKFVSVQSNRSVHFIELVGKLFEIVVLVFYRKTLLSEINICIVVKQSGIVEREDIFR